MKKNTIKAALRRIKRPRLFAVCASLVFALLLVMGATFAWLVSSDSAKNEMGIMQYQFGAFLDEIFTPPGSPIGGNTVPKQVNVENPRDIPAFVRVMVFPTLVADDGVTLVEMQIGTQVILGTLGGGWVDGGDGYYYCCEWLAPGGTTTEPLFEDVKLHDNIVGSFPDAKLNIALILESIDATGSHYRNAWWGGIVPTTGTPLSIVDTALQANLGP